MTWLFMLQTIFLCHAFMSIYCKFTAIGEILILIMNLMTHFNKTCKLLFLVGCFPLMLNKKSNTVESNRFVISYTIIFSIVYNIVSVWLNFYYYLPHGIAVAVSDSVSFMIITFYMIVMMSFTMVISVTILNRKSQAKFFNKIKDLDEMVEKGLQLLFTDNYQYECIHQIIVILLSNMLFVIVSYINPYFNSKVLAIIPQLLTSWQIMILNLSSNHIRNCAVLIINRSSKLYLTVNHHTDPQKIILTLKCFKKVFELKEHLEKAFGTHILLLCVFDFFFITISLYRNMHGFMIESGWISLLHLTTTTLPQIIKCVYLIAALEKLAEQVRIICLQHL